MMSIEPPNSKPAASGAKPRGCFQCSKRRITCDLGHPTCKKCIKKGIECSGLGRFRFNDGVARRGRLKGCQLPTLDPLPEEQKRTQGAPVRIRWQQRRGKNSEGGLSDERSSKRVKLTSRDSLSDTPSPNSTQLTTTIAGDGRSPEQRPSNEFTYQSQHWPSNSEEMVIRRRFFSPQNQPLQPWVSPLGPEARMLFSHFSEAVAPVMVVLDSISNGYRDVILPMACEDEVLRRAISVVAAQHLGQKRPELQAAAERGRAAVISRLRRDALQASPDQVFNLYTWATLIVLLVGETVTGSGEYGYLVQMLLCLSRTLSNLPKDGASSFLMQQTHMFEFLSKPLLEDPADCARQNPSSLDYYLDWLPATTTTTTSSLHSSTHASLISTTRQAFLQAFRLHSAAAAHDPDPQLLLPLLSHLQHLVRQIDPAAPCAHALVWVCFIGAAAPGADAAQRDFFAGRMRAVYERTGFGNIPAAVRALEGIWAQQRRRGRTAATTTMTQTTRGTLVEGLPVLVM